MRRVTIDTAHPYEVLIDRGLLDRVGEKVLAIKKSGHIQIVSDSNVAPLYAERVITSLEKAGFSTDLNIVEAGEGAKTIAVWQWLLEDWAQKEVHRDALICALGGGVIGDLSGFAAASYQRGTSFFQIPTTFLAAIDSSVGGKTAVNLNTGKNLVGAFHQPLLVLCDPDSFLTLDKDTFEEGVAEALKYGILADHELFNCLAQEKIQAESPNLDRVIENCVRLKNIFVSEDTFDKGMRQQLNFGHTPAHAIEVLSDYVCSHGEAVAIGLATMARAGEAIGFSDEGTADKIERALKTYDFPLASPYGPQAMAEISRRDKKAGQDGITVVLPRRIGQAELVPQNFEQLQTLYELGKEPLCR